MAGFSQLMMRNKGSSMTLNINKVGNPSISSSYLASNFSDSNYLVMPSSFSPGNNTWEFITKINIARLSQNADDRQTIVARNTATRAFQLTLYEDNTIAFSISSNGSSNYFSDIKSTNTFSINTDYWISLSWNGSAYLLKYSTDGTNWITTKTYNSTVKVYSGAILRMGNNYYTGSGNIYSQFHEPFSGSIDLKETKLIINNTITWTAII